MAYDRREFRRRWQIVVIVLLAASALATPRAQTNLGSGTMTPVPDDPGWQLYKNDALGFEMQFPATWTARSSGDMVEFTPPATERKLSEVWFGPVQPVRNAWFRDFDQFTRTYEHDVQASGSSILSRRSMVVAGYPAMRLAYEDRFSASGHPIVVDFLIGVPVTPEGLAYRLFYVTDAAAAQSDSAVYRRILSSLKIRR